VEHAVRCGAWWWGWMRRLVLGGTCLYANAIITER
jgi:hypothetical protein